jgi:Protein of unknown function (DUF3047)
MAVVGWCKLSVVVLLLLMQACAMQSAGVDQADGSTRQNTVTEDAFVLFPAVHQPGTHPDRLANAKTAKPANTVGSAIWQHHQFPGKQPTQYSYERISGQHTVMASASSSASMLRQSVRIEPASLQTINFSWKVAQLIPGADLSQRDTHDSPVRLVLAFEGDRSEFSMKNAMLSELSLALTGEPMPYATLMYVWCNACAKEDWYVSPRTDRIREIALETGPEHLGQWLNYQRDVPADYLKAYGQAPGALVGVGIMTDTDNTRQSAVAWYGPISLTTPSPK